MKTRRSSLRCIGPEVFMSSSALRLAAVALIAASLLTCDSAPPSVGGSWIGSFCPPMGCGATQPAPFFSAMDFALSQTETTVSGVVSLCPLQGPPCMSGTISGVFIAPALTAAIAFPGDTATHWTFTGTVLDKGSMVGGLTGPYYYGGGIILFSASKDSVWFEKQ